MAGASHRVVTETTRIAMPEISIGLFPDVGATWFLKRMPDHLGLFIALTGAPLNGHDARVVGLADHVVPTAAREAVFSGLTAVAWGDRATDNHEKISQVLREFTVPDASLPVANLQENAAIVESLCRGDSLDDVVARITGYNGENDWLKRAATTLAAGSPTTARLIWELRQRADSVDLTAAFRLELIVALQCCAHPDFAEGVRALLIDKDNAPRWTPRTLKEVTPQWLAEHFVAPPWPNGVHPLADLQPNVHS